MYVIDAGGIDSFWAAHLKVSSAGGPEELLSVHLSNPLGKPAIDVFKLWLNPMDGVTESLCVVPRKDGSVQLTFPRPVDEEGETRVTDLQFVGEFCSVLGFDEVLGLGKEASDLSLLRAELDRLRKLEAEEEKKAVYEERIAFGLDLASEQIHLRQERLKQSRWWTPIVALPSAALRFVAGSIDREESKSADRAKLHRNLQNDYLLMMVEVQKKVLLVQGGMNEVKKKLICHVSHLKVGPDRRLRKAVDGRCIFLVNNQVGASLLNGEVNEALADVSSLAWRLVMMLGAEGEACSELELFARERLYAQRIRAIRGENFMRFCSPGMLEGLRDAAGLHPNWLAHMLDPVSISSSTSIRSDWNSSLTPMAGDLFVDVPVMMKDGSKKRLSHLLGYGFCLLFFGSAPAGLPSTVPRIVVLDVGQKPPATVFLAAALQSKLEVVSAVEQDHAWRRYHASEGSVVLLRPDLRVECRSASWDEEFEASVKRAVSGKSNSSDINSFYWQDGEFGSDKMQDSPIKVHIWDALPTRWSIFWILCKALLQFQPKHREALLSKILPGLGRSVESGTDLTKQTVSACVGLGLQMFELQDVVEGVVESFYASITQLKHSKSSLSINSADSRSAEENS
jgi:hypothetical protein